MKDFTRKLNKVHIAISAIFLAIFLITILIQVITRLLGIAILWTQDVSIYSFIISVFLGASAMVYPEKHFAFVSLVDNIKSEKRKKVIHLCIAFFMLILMILMLYYGIIVTKKFWNYQWINVPQFRRGYTWLSLPVSGALGSYYLIVKIYYDIQDLVKGDTH